MKTTNSIYGAIAIGSIVLSSILSYRWGVTGSAILAILALLSGAAFVWATASSISSVERGQRAAVTKVDFEPHSLGKAA